MGDDSRFKHQTDPSNGMKFSTPDNDNDKEGSNCAVSYRSGWWYHSCFYININTQPAPSVSSRTQDAHFTEMKIRLKNCII